MPPSPRERRRGGGAESNCSTLSLSRPQPPSDEAAGARQLRHRGGGARKRRRARTAEQRRSRRRQIFPENNPRRRRHRRRRERQEAKERKVLFHTACARAARKAGRRIAGDRRGGKNTRRNERADSRPPLFLFRSLPSPGPAGVHLYNQPSLSSRRSRRITPARVVHDRPRQRESAKGHRNGSSTSLQSVTSRALVRSPSVRQAGGSCTAPGKIDQRFRSFLSWSGTEEDSPAPVRWMTITPRARVKPGKPPPAFLGRAERRRGKGHDTPRQRILRKAPFSEEGERGSGDDNLEG